MFNLTQLSTGWKTSRKIVMMVKEKHTGIISEAPGTVGWQSWNNTNTGDNNRQV